jgi:hypothetical protein
LHIPIGFMEPGAFFRVTLSNPVGGELDSVWRAYFSAETPPDAPLQLGVAVYADEMLLHWANPSALLQAATIVTGPWVTASNAVSPIRIPRPQTSEFFRLTR